MPRRGLGSTERLVSSGGLGRKASGSRENPPTEDAVDDRPGVGRAGRPEEVADLAVYLCSDKARYITGAIVTIDGGLTLEEALGA